MNAKERLRAYLEQRRELGESEMVLDALDVDDVMRMLGALQGGASADAPRAEASRAEPTTVPPVGAPPPRPSAPVVPDMQDRVVFGSTSASAPPASDDWREVMRSLQGNTAERPPTTPVPAPAPRESSPAASQPTREPLSGALRVEGIVAPLGLRVERPSVLVSAVGNDWRTLAEVADAIAACRACGLVRTATRPVPGVGDPAADVMVVGEAPGEQEDLIGEPFVGPAGELLNKILGAIQLSRESVYICNVLKHRPPGNRNPMPDEVRACAPFLQRQIDLVQPRMILAFGTFAAQSLLGTKLGIGKLRQQLHWYQGIPLIATYHPAALLRNEAWKRPTWEDIKLARRILDATIRA